MKRAPVPKVPGWLPRMPSGAKPMLAPSHPLGKCGGAKVVHVRAHCRRAPKRRK